MRVEHTEALAVLENATRNVGAGRFGDDVERIREPQHLRHVAIFRRPPGRPACG
jgi:hypothetical protein